MSKEDALVKMKERQTTFTKEICIKKYGVDNPMKNADILRKAIDTIIERYGVDNPQKNKEIREKFLYDTFGLKDIFGTKNVEGTRSSFGDRTNVMNRHKELDLPEETKELIRKDGELHYLMGALGYEYKKI
jgi:hypothetical protein